MLKKDLRSRRSGYIEYRTWISNQCRLSLLFYSSYERPLPYKDGKYMYFIALGRGSGGSSLLLLGALPSAGWTLSHPRTGLAALSELARVDLPTTFRSAVVASVRTSLGERDGIYNQEK